MPTLKRPGFDENGIISNPLCQDETSQNTFKGQSILLHNNVLAMKKTIDELARQVSILHGIIKN